LTMDVVRRPKPSYSRIWMLVALGFRNA